MLMLEIQMGGAINAKVSGVRIMIGGCLISRLAFRSIQIIEIKSVFKIDRFSYQK